MQKSDISFSIEFEAFGVKKEFQGRKNVIYEVRAWMVGTNTVGGSYKVYFVQHINTDDLDNFIEYENVTREDVVRWVYENASENHIEALKQKVLEEFFPQTEYLVPNF